MSLIPFWAERSKFNVVWAHRNILIGDIGNM